MYNTINQKENLFSSNDDYVKVNIVTGRMIYEHPVLSIGQGNFNINLSLCYNSQGISQCFPDRRIGFGNGWKFSFEQQVFPYKGEYNLEGFNEGDYVYIDSYCNIYRFIKYKINGNATVYIDSLGSGLYLKVIDQFYSIGTETESYLLFDKDGYIKSYRNVEHNGTYKEIKMYESENINNGNIIKIYDLRDSEKAINIQYMNNKPIRIWASNSPTSYLIKYDEYEQMSSLIEYHSGKYYSTKKYFYENKLTYVVDRVTNQGFKLNYFNNYTKGIYQIQSVKIGTFEQYISKSQRVNKNYSSNNQYCTEDDYAEFENEILELRYEMLNGYEKESISYLYEDGSTIEKGSTDVKIEYFYDNLGNIIGILEKDDENNYYEINQNKQWPILNNNTISSTSINTMYERAIDSGILSITKENELPFNEFINYFSRDTENKYSYIEDFYLSFWLKCDNDIQNNPKIRLRIESPNEIVNEKCFVSNAFAGKWQQIIIPFSFNTNVSSITNFVLDFTDIDTLNSVFIANAYIMIGSKPKMYCLDNCFDDSEKIIYKYIDENTHEEVKEVVDITSNFYISHSDMLKTMRNLYLSEYKNQSNFTLIYCNNKKVKNITKLGFVLNDEEIYFNSSSYFNVMSKERKKSNLWSITQLEYDYGYDDEQEEHYVIEKTYIESVDSYNKTLDTQKAEKFITETYFNGHIKSKTDNYGVKILYQYDSYFNLLAVHKIDTKDTNSETNTLIEYVYKNTIDEFHTVPIIVRQNGIETEYSYNELNNVLESYKIGSLLTYYDYNPVYKNIEKIYFYDINNNTPTNTMNITYDAFNNVKNYRDNNFDYWLAYDNLNDCVEVFKNNNSINKVTYKTKYSTITKDNKNRKLIQKDKYGNIKKIYNNNDLTSFVYQYDINEPLVPQNEYEKLEFNQYNLKSSPYSGKLVKINDIKNNIKHIIFRDENGLENGFETNDSNNEMITRVLKNGNTEKQSVVLQLYDEPFELSYIKEYKTDKDNIFVPNKRITEMSLKKEGNSEFNIKYNYRYEDQNSSIVRNSTTNNTDYKVAYAKDNGTLSSITRKSQISIQENNETKNVETCLTETLHYDNIKQNGNIVKISYNGSELRYYEENDCIYDKSHNINDYVEYSYDNLNRLTKEVTKSGNIIEYQYDSCGNLLKITTNNTTKEFDNTEDRCNNVKINGYTKNITYDDHGNIIKYGDFEYIYNNLNQLIQCIHIKDNIKMIYKYYYDFADRRFRKLISTEKNNNIIKLFDYYYYYNGNQLMSISCHNYEENNTRYIHYFYDEIGLCGLEYDGNYYGIICDTLGNVSKITDNDRVIIEYTYDAFGNTSCKLVSGEDFYFDYFYNKIIELNTLTYRGYHYDVETNLALVSSRYYSPELGRFIQPADVSSLNPQSINGLNLYTYAVNNPISFAYNSSVSNVGTAIESVNSSMNSGISNNKLGNLYSNSINIMGGLHALSSAFAFVDQWSGFLSGGLDGGLGYWGPEGFGIQSLGKYSSMVSKFGKGMIIAGSILSWGSSVYNNFNNPNYTMGEAFGASAMDAGYYTAKGVGTYYAGIGVGKAAVGLGIAAGGAAITYLGVGFAGALAIGGGVAVVVGIAGAVAIYYLGELLDYGWSELKKALFE